MVVGVLAVIYRYGPDRDEPQWRWVSPGAVIVLLLWLFLSAFIVLVGGEVNAEMEHQTARDTTVGEPRPMGRRDAQVADHVGERYR